MYGNTRLARSIRAHQDQSGVGAVSKASGEAVRREQFAVDGNEVGADRSPAVNGYGFVATPSIAPGKFHDSLVHHVVLYNAVSVRL